MRGGDSGSGVAAATVAAVAVVEIEAVKAASTPRRFYAIYYPREAKSEEEKESADGT